VELVSLSILFDEIAELFVVDVDWTSVDSVSLASLLLGFATLFFYLSTVAILELEFFFFFFPFFDLLIAVLL